MIIIPSSTTISPSGSVWLPQGPNLSAARAFAFAASSSRLFGGAFVFERAEKTGRDAGYFIDCSQQRAFVCFRRFVKTADFSHELERSSPNLFGGDGRIEIEEDFDIPAHHYDLKVQNAQGAELCSGVTVHLSSILR